MQNVFELDRSGREVCGWCFAPAGNLVAGDVMLAQKVALETDDGAVMKVANRFGDTRLSYLSNPPDNGGFWRSLFLGNWD